MDDASARTKIIETARRMAAEGLVQGTGGNFSVRCREGMLITPSGMDYSLLLPKDIPKLSLECSVLEGSRIPSVESALHAAVYTARPDVSAVIHTHSVYAVAAAAMRRPLPPLCDNQAVLFGGAVACAEYAPIGTRRLAENAASALGNGFGVLLANHGAVCVGATIEEASMRCVMLEVFAKIFFLTASCGGGVSLTAEEAEAEYRDISSRYGQRRKK